MLRVLDISSLVVYVFGALAFSTLVLFYWGERRRGKNLASTAFPAFTLVCAIAFLSNLLFQTGIPQSAAAWTEAALLAIRGMAVGLMPPLIFHLVLESRGTEPATQGIWRCLRTALYAAGAGISVAQVLQDNRHFPAPLVDYLYRAPAVELAAAAVMGLLFQAVSGRPSHAGQRAHRVWIAVLMAILLMCAAATLGDAGAYVGQLPDYVVLAFFAINLYYRERLVFFDVLMKRGVFLAIGLAALTAAFAVTPRPSMAWLFGFGMLVWLAGPAVHGLVSRVIDRVWLRRGYSPVEAERQFIQDVQGAASEEELRSNAIQSLSAIFQAPAQVEFGDENATPAAEDDSLSAALEHAASRHGWVRLSARPNGIPFLSDDRRLLQSLACTLGMVLENVRFRADRRRAEEREQQLRLLASRAELKALRAQIDPHFLFNALSVIAGLMHGQPELADATIERLAQVFRYTLRKSDHEWTPLGEEVEFVTAYLGIEQARFGERLQVSCDVDPAAARIPIPAMSIQPLIENAIKHGVAAKETRGTVRLRAALEGGRLCVEVRDDGPGFPPDFSLAQAVESHGLRNVADRLRGYYGESAQLSWDCGKNGTRVRFTIPQAAPNGAGAAAHLTPNGVLQ